MDSKAISAGMNTSPLHGLETVGCGLDGFSSCNIDVHEEESSEEFMAQAPDELFAHPGFVHSASEDVQDNLIAAQDWLEVSQAHGTSLVSTDIVTWPQSDEL